MKKLSLLATMAVVAAASLATPPALAQTTELIFNTYLPPFNPGRKVGVDEFAKRVEEESGGSIKVTVPDASLAPSNQQYELLLDGIADMAWLPTDDMSQLVTFSGITDLPGHAPDPRSASIAFWETYKKYFEQHGEYKGVKILYVNALGGRQPMGIDEPIDSVDDFNNKKVWLPNGPITELMSNFGIVPVHVNFPQLFETVSKGLVDQLIASPGAVFGSGLTDAVHHYTIVPGGLGSVSFATAIRQESWDALTEDQKAAVLRAAEGWSGATGAAVTGLEENGLAKMKEAGLQIIDAPEEMMAELRPLMDEQVEAWKERAAAKGLENPDEVVEFYRSVLERETAGN